MEGNIVTDKELRKKIEANKDEIIIMFFAQIWEEMKKIIQEGK